MAQYYLGDTLVDDSQFTIGLDGATLINPPAPTAPPSGGAMSPEQQAAYVAKFDEPFVPDMGWVANYGEGLSGYEGGRYLGQSQYGPTITDARNGNLIWSGQEWIPVPEASGSLFGDFIAPIALFAGLAAGGGALAGLGEAGAAGAAGAGAGAAAADAGALYGLELGGAGVGAADLGLGYGAASAAGAGALEGLPLISEVAPQTVRPEWFNNLLNPTTSAEQTFAPWANADPTLPFGSEEWLASAGQGTTMLNGQVVNLPEWIAANPVASLATGARSASVWETVKDLMSQGKTASQALSAAKSVLGVGGAVPKTGTGAGTGTGGGSGMSIIPINQNKSILETMMGAEDGNGLDEFMRLMAQSGKGA